MGSRGCVNPGFSPHSKNSTSGINDESLKFGSDTASSQHNTGVEPMATSRLTTDSTFLPSTPLPQETERPLTFTGIPWTRSSSSNSKCHADNVDQSSSYVSPQHSPAKVLSENPFPTIPPLLPIRRHNRRLYVKCSDEFEDIGYKNSSSGGNSNGGSTPPGKAKCDSEIKPIFLDTDKCDPSPETLGSPSESRSHVVPVLHLHCNKYSVSVLHIENDSTDTKRQSSLNDDLHEEIFVEALFGSFVKAIISQHYEDAGLSSSPGKVDDDLTCDSEQNGPTTPTQTVNSMGRNVDDVCPGAPKKAGPRSRIKGTDFGSACRKLEF
eukprot:Gb_09649 [translate_table: standard]